MRERAVLQLLRERLSLYPAVVLGRLSQLGKAVEPFFFRTSDGYEIDLVLDFGRRRWAVEIKLTTSPSTEDMARLRKTAGLIKAYRWLLVSRTDEVVEDERQASCNLPWLLKSIEDLD